MEMGAVISLMITMFAITFLAVVAGNYVYYRYIKRAEKDVLTDEGTPESSVYLDATGRFYTNRPPE